MKFSKRLKIILIIVVIFSAIFIYFFGGTIYWKYIKKTPNPSIAITKVEKELQDGKYYLNGDKSKCYFNVNDNHIQLISDEKQYEELFALSNDGTYGESYLSEWISTEKETWSEPKEYIIAQFGTGGEYGILIHWTYHEDGYIKSATSIPYVNENEIKYIKETLNKCPFKASYFPKFV